MQKPLAEGKEQIHMAKDYRPVSAEAQVEALRTLVAAVTATREGASPAENLAPGLLDVLDGLEPRESALVSELLMSIAFRAGSQVSERYPGLEEQRLVHESIRRLIDELSCEAMMSGVLARLSTMPRMRAQFFPFFSRKIRKFTYICTCHKCFFTTSGKNNYLNITVFPCFL